MKTIYSYTHNNQLCKETMTQEHYDKLIIAGRSTVMFDTLDQAKVALRKVLKKEHVGYQRQALDFTGRAYAVQVSMDKLKDWPEISVLDLTRHDDE